MVYRDGPTVIPEQVQTKHGLIQVKVLSWLQYIRYRASIHGWKYLFTKTSVGYPQFLALGYYSRSRKEIAVARVLNWELRYLHEVGHANGLKHVWIDGDVMHPYGYKRGSFTHICISDEVWSDCGNVVSFESCGDCKLGCPFIKRRKIM